MPEFAVEQNASDLFKDSLNPQKNSGITLDSISETVHIDDPTKIQVDKRAVDVDQKQDESYNMDDSDMSGTPNVEIVGCIEQSFNRKKDQIDSLKEMPSADIAPSVEILNQSLNVTNPDVDVRN